MHLTSSWFTLSGAGGFKALISGVLLAIFLYSGWDTAAYVGEEATGKQAGPAAVTSVDPAVHHLRRSPSWPSRAWRRATCCRRTRRNILAYVGQQIGGSFWKQVMIVAVLGRHPGLAPGRDRQLVPDLVRDGP